MEHNDLQLFFFPFLQTLVFYSYKQMILAVYFFLTYRYRIYRREIFNAKTSSKRRHIFVFARVQYLPTLW